MRSRIAAEPSSAPLDAARARGWLRALLVVIGVLVALDLVGHAVESWRGPQVHRWSELVCLDAVPSLPTWFASAQVLLAAIAAFVAGERAEDDALRRAWRFVVALLLSISIDEVAQVRERLATLLLAEPVLHSSAAIGVWCIGGAVVLALAAAAVPFLGRLSPALRRELIIAAVVYVTGGLVLEAFGQQWAARHGLRGWTYVALTAAEASCEMLGVWLFLRAVVGSFVVEGVAEEARRSSMPQLTPRSATLRS